MESYCLPLSCLLRSIGLKPNLYVSSFKCPCLPPNLVNACVVPYTIYYYRNFLLLNLILFCFASTTRQICTVFPTVACKMVLGWQNALHKAFSVRCWVNRRSAVHTVHPRIGCGAPFVSRCPTAAHLFSQVSLNVDSHLDFSERVAKMSLCVFDILEYVL